MKTRSPRTWQDDDLVAAFESAVSAVEPVFVPAALFCDDRGWSLMNQMRGVMTGQGQINYSVIFPHVVKAWHRHQKQTDFWVGLHGCLKAGIYREADGVAWLAFLGERRPGVMVIPPSLWHGVATVGSENAGLLYYVTHAYDPQQPDEVRRAFDSIQGFPWGVRHG